MLITCCRNSVPHSFVHICTVHEDQQGRFRSYVHTCVVYFCANIRRSVRLLLYARMYRNGLHGNHLQNVKIETKGFPRVQHRKGLLVISICSSFMEYRYYYLLLKLPTQNTVAVYVVRLPSPVYAVNVTTKFRKGQ